MNFKTTALLIIGMQKDGQNLIKSSVAIVPYIKTALDIARKKNMPIIYIVRIHRKNGTDVELFRCSRFKESPYLVQVYCHQLIETRTCGKLNAVNRRRTHGSIKSIRDNETYKETMDSRTQERNSAQVA